MSPAEQLLTDILADPGLKKESRSLARNAFLLREGQIEHYIYVVKTGAIRIFYLTEHEEHTIRFGYPGSIITSIPAFYDGSASMFYLQALRKTEVIQISRQHFFDFIKHDALRLNQYRHILEDFSRQQIEREIDLLTYSPRERYERVFERSPQLFQHIPAKYIAAYLRMSPETLSRLQAARYS